MRLASLVTGILMVSANVYAQGATDMSLQLSRYDQLIDRLMKQNQQLMADVRGLQRENMVLGKRVEEAQNRTQQLTDDMQKVQNLAVTNLGSGQKQLADRINSLDNQLNNKLSGQMNAVWGMGTRDCSDLGVKHQQIKAQLSPDGGRAVKFLCYDGKVLHLGTEVYDLGK